MADCRQHIAERLGEGAGRRGGPLNRHTLDVRISPHLLQDFYWPPFRGAIRAGARGVT